MAFADSVFDGNAILDDIESKKVNRLSLLRGVLNEHIIIPLITKDLPKLLRLYAFKFM